MFQNSRQFITILWFYIYSEKQMSQIFLEKKSMLENNGN